MDHQFLKDIVMPIDVEKTETVSEILNAFNDTSFQSRNLAKCVEIFVRMLKDYDKPTIFLGLADAMIPAGMKKVISTMVRKRMVHVIVTTGANAYHDVVKYFGYYHYEGSPTADDTELYRYGIDRIYDTYASESQYRQIDQKIAMLAAKIRQENPDLVSVSSIGFLSELGKLVDKEGSEEDK